MRKTELVTGSLAVAGIMMKFMFIPLADFTLVVSLTLLSTYYFLFGFTLTLNIDATKIFKKSSYFGKSISRIIGGVGLGWVLSTLILGIMFKLLFYPGATYQLSVGLIGLALVLLVSIILSIQKRRNYLQSSWKRLAIYGVLSILVLIPSKNTLVDIYYSNWPEYAKLYKKHLADPDNDTLFFKLQEMTRLDDLQRD